MEIQISDFVLSPYCYVLVGEAKIPVFGLTYHIVDKYWEDQDLVYEDFKAYIKIEGRDVDFNMSEEEIESGIEEPLYPALENIAGY